MSKASLLNVQVKVNTGITSVISVRSFSKPATSLVALLTISVFLLSFHHLFSQSASGKVSFGRTETINVYPADVRSDNWMYIENAAVQELGEDALFQDFVDANSARVPRSPGELDAYFDELEEQERRRQEQLDAAALEQLQTPTLSEPPSSAPENVDDPFESEADESPVQLELEAVKPTVEASSTVDASIISTTGRFVSSMFKRVTSVFPFAQQSTTTPIPESAPLAEGTEDQNVELEPEGTGTAAVLGTSSPAATEGDGQSQETAETETGPDSTADTNLLEETATTSVEIVEEIVNDTASTSIPTTSAETIQTEVSSSSAATDPTPPDEVSTSSSRTEDAVVHEVVLSDFGVPQLQPGQFIVSSQLRLSFAAKVRNYASTTQQIVEVLFGQPGDLTSVGLILIDGETSNALNGGYFLFALPISESPELLKDAQVVVRYAGDQSLLRGMYLDAAWVEIDTKVITKADLEKRGKAAELKHLAKPSSHELVSDALNFKRGERPVFNLRYESQRNAVVRNFRNLIGRSLVEVQSVELVHRSFGPSGIEANITTTEEGLISISVSEKDLERMRPGQYSLTIVSKEGGQVSEDTFDFQYGILAINPDKSEYEVAEEAFISIGALTPNGHTICQATLALYVTDPDGRVHKVPVSASGVCDGNNVVDVPDFSAVFPVTQSGTYELYLERLGNDGSVLGFTTDTFTATQQQDIGIKRYGPSRIYPPARYPMQLTVTSEEAFVGTLIERVPLGFTIDATSAEVTVHEKWQELTWEIAVPAGGARTVSYTFDAPDLSPYLYTVGPAQVRGEELVSANGDISSTTSSESVGGDGMVAFEEHRKWQIASDAVGNMILYWDDGASIPTDWTCLSCGSGTFYQRFVMGSSTYNTTGGSALHTHTVSDSALASNEATTEDRNGTVISNKSHSHTITTTVPDASNLPLYRELRVIQYTAAAGEPATIPAGAIAMFDVASSSLPAGWNRYAAQDGYYVYGGNTPGATSGANEHTHAITGTLNAATGGTEASRGGGGATGALDAHTHTFSTTTTEVSNEPPYREVLFAKLASDAAPDNGIIAMWTEDVDGGWIDVSSSGADPFSNRFLKASTTYGLAGGSETHSHSDMTSVVSNTTTNLSSGNVPAGTEGASSVHTHNISLTSFSSQEHLPPYLTAVFGKRQGNNPVYNQTSYQWFTNINAETPTDEWPTGVTLDLAEREPITSTSTPVKEGDEVRLRINVGVTNATSTIGSTFKLQYAAATNCSAVSSWTTVGDTSSTTLWRGYNNTSVSDHATLGTLLLASSTVAGTYEENGYATSTPNDIAVGAYGEWDFVLQHNGAAPGTVYCFRMVEGDGTTFITYDSYPRLLTNAAPAAPTQSKLFDNEKTASTSPFFQFVSTDAEGDKVHYEIEVDNDYSFGSPEIDRNTISNSSLFENQLLISDKAPFISGNLIEFRPSTALTNGVTYYWRVRAQDPSGSGEWGDWSTIRSFTIDTALTASAWFQTEDEQFDTNTLVGVETGGDEISFITGSTTGTTTSSQIDFDDGDLGTAWDNFSFNDTGSVTYFIEYNDGSDWLRIPDSDLSGNGSGFTSSPVNLLTLDTSTYSNLRIVAVFTNTVAPSLQDWTINWGYRVETPTINKTFPNEQVGTTSPTFEFYSSDPQNDDLTYQVQFSEQYDFSASTTYTSDIDATFENSEDVGDTQPFTSGEVIRFVPSTPLSGATTTYWFRVRAKDPNGADAYSFWTNPQSFTVVPGTEVSTWLQTTQEQFDTNILSGTQALSSDVVAVATTASEAMLVYGEGTSNTPRYRQWNGSTWSSEGSMQEIGAPVKWAVVEAGTTREEYVAATVGTDNDINVQVFSTGEWGNLFELTSNMGDINARGFDIAYETNSGDAMVVYCDGGADPSYYLWDGIGWNASGTINLASTNNCEWIQLASDPVSDEIIVLSRDSTGSQYEAQVWNGSGWGNSTVQGSITEPDHEGMAVEYEESGGQAIIVTSDGNPARMRWDSWNGAAWAGNTVETLGDDLEWGKLVRDIGSDEMVLCHQNEDTDVEVIRWTGAAWAGLTELTANANAKNDPGFACAFENGGARDNYIMVVYSDTAQVSSSSWNNAAWSTGVQINSITNSATMDLIRTGTDDLLGVFFNHPNDSLLFSQFDGASWSATQILENDMSVDTSPYGQPYDISPRNSGREGTTIVSPGIDFDDGLGPYWQRFSWNDNQPGTSEILYRVQYQTATGSWAFIPDVDLPGNGSGTTTGPFDLTGLNTNTYNVLRPYAALTCDGSGNCPTISDWTVTWAGGITVSGTIEDYTQTSDVTSGTVAVAVNGVLQTGKTGTIAGGAWSISNVTTFPGDVVTVFVSGAGDTNEAVGVTRYSGFGDIEGMQLFERHLSLGDNAATTTALTNADLGLYDGTVDEDVFFNASGTALTACADTGCGDVRIFINASTTYAPGGRVVTHDLQIDGTFVAGANTIEVNGSWDNNGTTTMTNSTVVFAATSSSETIDSTGAPVSSFNNITFGTTTGSGTWSLITPLDVNGNLTVSRGTLARGTTPITVAGTLTTGANGFWAGLGTTTFDGAAAASWADQNATLQNVGYAVIDGSNKVVTLSGNVAAESVTIGANDTLDASNSNYDITVYGSWVNNNNFLPRSGEVVFAATSSGQTITTSGDAFYDLTFSGANGTWSFTETTLLVNNNFTISTGTVTLPSATTTIAGSFDSTGGTFAHSNGTLLFTSAGAETLTFDGSGFLNPTHNLVFNGGGSWAMNDTHATTTNDVRMVQGSVTFPSGVYAIGGSLNDVGGSFAGNNGTVRFYSSASETLTAGGSNFATAVFDGSGSWSFSDTNVAALGDLLILNGSLTLPSGTLTIGGSYDNNATVTAGTGTLRFNSSNSGETVDFGTSDLYNVIFDGVAGGWTILADATTTNNFTLGTSSDFTLTSGAVLSVGNVFTNTVGGASTTWTGSTLYLTAGDYSINDRSDAGDAYDTLAIAGNTDVAMWNSVASTYVVDPTASLYSQDHNAVDGDLYIFGEYVRTSGTENWSYATDFDGTDLTGSERQVDVRFAAAATASFTNSTLSLLGSSTASTTIANQGAGTYTISVDGGTTTARYYEFTDLGSTGLSLLGGTVVTSLRDGSYEPAVASGVGLTLSSTTIDANPAKQIFNVQFATTTAISAFNVAQLDGDPASFWWFRDGSGNLYGEDFDNDTGNPGSVRFDDSALNLTLSGTVYQNDTVTPITGGTCDDVTPVVRVMVDGVLSTTTSCSSVDGSYVASGVEVVGDPTITVFLNNASGGEQASVITRTPTTNITNLHLYANRVIVRNEDTSALSIANLAVYDETDDTDLRFRASTSTTPNVLEVREGTELHVFASSTFTPGGIVTLSGNGGANDYDGTLYLDSDATFNAYSSTTLTIAGRLELEANATFEAASTTVLFTATTTGKSITSGATVSFYDLTFNGAGGGWNVGADIDVTGDMVITTGTVTGTGDITLVNGSLTGNGVLSMGGGTTTLERSNSLGGTSAWTFYDLVLGNGTMVGTTTPLFTSTTTVSGELVIANAHFFDAGATTWDLAGVGTVFTETGTFLEDTSTIRYSGSGANVLNTSYYNLDINAGAGSPTYTAIGAGLIVLSDLTVGGQAPSTFDLTTNDPSLDVDGDVIVRSNGTFSASNSSLLTIGGSYDNDGVFTSNNGTTTFDGSGTVTIAAGSSAFGHASINGTGDFTLSESATSSGNWILTNHNSFTVSGGVVLAVGADFFNALGGAATTWTGSILRLFSGTEFTANTKSTSDTYGTLDINGSTQVRLWNSDAAVYDVAATASLYSQDHGDVAGDLYIWGNYRPTNSTDFWSYATDFDGTVLGGGSRKVDVFFATSASAVITGGALQVVGASGASTTIQSQSDQTYGLRLGGTAAVSMQYYEVRDIDSSGLVFSGAPTVSTLSNGDLEVSQNAGSAMTVGGTVINANPAKTFDRNRFALNGVGSGFNVTATGTSVSSWRFTNHLGGLDGEANDSDPGGDPGYVAWDDSAALITISGRVYSDEGSTVSTVCDGATTNISLYIEGILFGNTSCNGATGLYSFSNVSYGPTDSLIVYINGEAVSGAAVTEDPVSNIGNLHIYENRVIVRHENTDPLSIADMAIWDSSDDPDVPFTAVDAGTDSLTLPADTKLLVWDTKEFEPGGNVTLAGAGAGGAEDGTLELQANAIWTAQGSENLSIGGSMLLGAGATFTAANGTTTFTSTAAGRTIDVNANDFYNLTFTGSGSWTIADSTLTVGGYLAKTAGTLTLPSGTTTVSASFENLGGTFDANSGLLILDGAGTYTLAGGGSSFADVRVTGSGSFTMSDTHATTTGSFLIENGTITLPSGTLAVGGDFRNTGGAFVHNTSLLILTNGTSGLLLANSSDLYGVTINGAGSFTMEDTNLTLLDSLNVNDGSLTLASGTLSIGGSFLATGGTFDYTNPNATNTILFNSGDTGEVINPGVSDFYTVQIGAPAGGYTLTGNATTTSSFRLQSASEFTAQSGVTLYVGGSFKNHVGGSATNWNGSTLVIDTGEIDSINTKLDSGDDYQTLVIGANTDISSWFSRATTTIVDSTASFYSKDHGNVDGALNIYGDYHIATTTEYWSYTTDFDSTSLSGSERAVNVSIDSGSTVSVDGATLNMVGASGNETTVANQGAGMYSFNVSDGGLNAQHYAFRNLDVNGLSLTGTPVITSLDYGDFELAVDTGSLISLSSTTLNANASLIITGARFATTTAITGSNVALTGTTANVWTFTNHTGNLDGESFDIDGATACGSVRWDDSDCQITQQTHYRWRNDDGGLEVPASEWFDTDWDARKRVRIENADNTTYTDAVVELLVAYDADMQADFDDLRFTDSSGTTSIPFWIGSTTASVAAEVWVKVSSLPANETATVFMYYNNPTALGSSSASSTFVAADDFEDGGITEYTGAGNDKNLFTVDASHVRGGSSGLSNAGETDSRADEGGMARFDQTVSQGQTIRYWLYVDTTDTGPNIGTSDEVCTMFGVQSPVSDNNNYAVCMEQDGDDRIALVRDVVDEDISGTVLATSTLSTGDYETGWYMFEIDWGTDDSIFVSLYDESNILVATTSATDSTYTSGGYGFTYWFNEGGWDNFTVRPTLTNEPNVRFGAEQGDGGATWAAALDATAGDFNVGDVARLRIAIENSGTAISNQQFRLDYAEQGAAPSCEAVDPNDYVAVPVQSSCGSSPICMQSSSNITNGASTVDLLMGTEGDFTSGEAREDPSNTTGNLNIAQDEYTELEYAVSPTVNVNDPNLCFRVTNSGTAYDTYLKVARMNVRFDPSFGTVRFNGGLPISLTAGTTTRVYATSTVVDLNGFADIIMGSSTMFTTAAGAACTPDNNSCYISTTDSQCSFTSCSGDSCVLECYADIFFHADATDDDGGQEWFAFLEAQDAQGGIGFATSPGIELYTLRAIDVDDGIDYGALAANSDTGSNNATTTITNFGNIAVDVEIEGTDLSDGISSTIPADQQKYATSSFTYNACVFCSTVVTSSPPPLDLDLGKPTTDSPPVVDDVFWGIAVPIGTNSAPHQGTNIFTPVSD